jgi:hypothetical protein
MATVNYSWNLPTVGGSEDTWGTSLNANWTDLDTLLGGVSQTEFAILDGATVTTAELNILDGVTADAAELNILDGVTASTAELNILDGVTASTAELNILDGVTSTATELNLLDGALDHATAAWEAGTATEAGVPSPAEVKAAIDALAGGEWTKIGSTTTLSNDATADFTLDTATYARFQLRFRQVVPATNAVRLLVQMSPDAGSTIRSTGYKHNLIIGPSSTSPTDGFGLTLQAASAAGSVGFNGDLLLQNVGAAGEKTVALLIGGLENYAGGTAYVNNAAGWYDTAEAHNLARVSFSSGNLASGEIELWGAVE